MSDKQEHKFSVTYLYRYDTAMHMCNVKVGKADEPAGWNFESSGCNTLEEYAMKVADRRVQQQDATSSAYPLRTFSATIAPEGFTGLQLEVNRQDRSDEMGDTARVDKPREWYKKAHLLPEGLDPRNLTDVQTLQWEKDVIQHFAEMDKELTGASCKPTAKPRFYQQKIINDTVGAWGKGARVIGWEICPRGGKTLSSMFTMLEFRKFGVQYVVLPAHALSSHQSFINELNDWSNFDDVVIVKYDDPNFTKKIEQNKDKFLLITVSTHTINKSRYNAVAKLDVDRKLAVIDEADLGAHTDKSMEVIKGLNCGGEIIMTGTALERAVLNRKVDFVTRLPYKEMLLIKHNTHPDLKYLDERKRREAVASCQSVPDVNFVKLNYIEAAVAQADTSDDFQISWSKILGGGRGNKNAIKRHAAIHTTLVNAMFKSKWVMDEHASMSLENPRVVFGFGAFGTNQDCIDCKDLYQSVLGDSWVVKHINSTSMKNATAEKIIEGVIKRAKKQGKKVLLLSKNMASRSFTIPEIDTVLLMFDHGSAPSIAQKLSRGGSGGDDYDGNPKNSFNVVHLGFDRNRVELDPIDKFIIAESQTKGNNVASNMREYLGTRGLNILEGNLHGQVPLAYDAYTEHLLSSSDLSNHVSAFSNITALNFTELSKGLLNPKKVKAAAADSDEAPVDIKDANASIEINCKEEEAKSKKAKSLEDQTKETVNHFLNNIGALAKFEIESDSIIGALNNIKGTLTAHEAERYYGLSVDTMINVVTDPHFACDILNHVFKQFRKNQSIARVL